MLQIAPVTLSGDTVRLKPLTHSYAADLHEAGQDERIWTYMSTVIHTREDAVRFIDTALKAQAAGVELPFVIIEQATGRVIGSTRFLNISKKDRGLEIGWTWLAPDVWKTRVNTECKWLLLRHCFEQLGCIRVQLKTDLRNLNSQRAIARIGGVREGVLRSHMVVRDGYIRDTVMFSILDREWPEVDQKLRKILGRPERCV
ncbi:GNAT family N-acetyltransferase [Brevibacillus massiliensis]|jgi:RimJ/RimL family protein N-acetyltransferase|uniref:GNAT family N-acetyltransferase n=1 Tax=Brevibacillus massiliensis TaxID=1118054 RepID=UPI00030776DB|nr:GNAT family N-acetyltransferase [Brevibacillus massiliensis]